MVLQDKTGHAQELYQLFSEYPEELLQEVFSSMRSDGIVTKIKAPVSNTHNTTCIMKVKTETCSRPVMIGNNILIIFINDGGEED